MLLVDNQSQLSTYADLSRAATICQLQAYLYSFFLFVQIFFGVFMSYLRLNETLFNIFFIPFIIIEQLDYPIYQIIVTIDASLTVFVLKTYRNVMIQVYKYIKKILLERFFTYENVTPVVPYN